MNVKELLEQNGVNDAEAAAKVEKAISKAVGYGDKLKEIDTLRTV